MYFNTSSDSSVHLQENLGPTAVLACTVSDSKNCDAFSQTGWNVNSRKEEDELFKGYSTSVQHSCCFVMIIYVEVLSDF